MSDPDTHDEAQILNLLSERDRMAKLRALGREMELRARVDVLQEALASKEQYYLERVTELNAQLEEVRAHLDLLKSQRDSLLVERDSLAAQVDRERRDAAAREHELANQLADVHLELQMLRNSRSWKITRPLRQVTRWMGASNPTVEEVRNLRRSAPPPQLQVEGASSPGSPEHSSHVDVIAELDRAVQQLVATVLPRLPLSPVKAAEAAEMSEPPEPVEPGSGFVTGGREAWDEEGALRLHEFLSSGRQLRFPAPLRPGTSIIIALYNKAHLTFLCLESLLQNAGADYELILVDNGSTDATGQLLDRLASTRIIRNRDNQGYGHACMQGAQAASGEFLCFLNNDVVLCAGTLEAALADLREDASVGAVGGKLLLSDGRLQEAGSMVWRDGTAWGYGREDDPTSRKYAFRRPVDYCSGALLFTPRVLFNELGGFDERFLPAYYEDTDYGFKIWNKGLKVIYEPGAVIHHYESASMPSSDAAKALVAEHRSIFVDKWRGRLARQPELAGEKVPCARISAQAGGRRILYMVPAIPHADSGMMQSRDFIARLSAEGHHLTCVSMAQSLQADDSDDLPRGIELADAKADTHYVFRELLSQYDLVWVTGHQGMREFLWHLWNMEERVPPIVYQPEEIVEEAPADAEENPGFEEEVSFCQAADIVVVRSEKDRQRLQRHRISRTEVLSADSVDKILVGLDR
jgi:O-antigen biosynthesis protein